jgi:hypothetical protein
MGRKIRISEHQKSILKQVEPDLLELLAELEELRHKVLLAEAASRVVLH